MHMDQLKRLSKEDLIEMIFDLARECDICGKDLTMHKDFHVYWNTFMCPECYKDEEEE